ncbi:LytR/AlgR family response regulator transcription factor [Clostridium omnivorum]|uniref:Stage 0 sporulation protein A homolog n=1 Tax=Clostridium omnivorum TaxID=1604902 RepID=A0ABQ5N2S7_9CLOT|nr:LytTR family DNA-binding domain-containing protein [Clostridium sp. E14]GLC29454.1 DNA-binding response regulator [Clostridium sp. E14]
MQLKVLLVDDEDICLEDLKSSLNMFKYIDVVAEATTGSDAIKFLQNNEKKVDLIFLDIEIKDINGFDLAKHIRSVYPYIKIIFLTGHVGFALKGYEFQPVDFLTKPINIIRLEESLSRVKSLKLNEKVDKEIKIGIHVEGGLEIIAVKDILYIEKKGRKVYIVCNNCAVYNSRDSVQKLESIFRNYGFFRCHQSFLIPINKIKRISSDEFTRAYIAQLEGVKESIPISREKYNELKELLKNKEMEFYL